ncbi:MAG: hypothetical protein JXA54_01220 [Candidatus Heimdallarchaeota archaeon]|nr:hypothetical protein [Candidatus Heimdallarchaeota archaeon]
MFKKANKKRSKNDQSKIKVILTPRIEKIFTECTKQVDESLFVSEECFNALLNYLLKVTSGYTTKINYLKELKTTESRQDQLIETKEIVYSLRETDSTSGDALNLLKEKLNLLFEERENFALKFLSLKEEIETAPLFEISLRINKFVESITFLETENWEEELDYYRTRFLFQKEQETDQELKDKFIPESEKQKELLDPLAKIKPQREIASNHILKTISLTKDQQKAISPFISKFNEIALEVSDSSKEEILEWTEEEVAEKLKHQELLSQEIGKELYALKREQGILTLKVYEILQTIRSRLLNISGSIASRIFLKDGIKEFYQILEDKSLTDIERKESINKIVARFLRILGEIKRDE